MDAQKCVNAKCNWAVCECRAIELERSSGRLGVSGIVHYLNLFENGVIFPHSVASHLPLSVSLKRSDLEQNRRRDGALTCSTSKLTTKALIKPRPSR